MIHEGTIGIDCMETYLISYTSSDVLMKYLNEHQIKVVKKMETFNMIVVECLKERATEIQTLSGVFHVGENKEHRLES